jgi:hypothetical protein
VKRSLTIALVFFGILVASPAYSIAESAGQRSVECSSDECRRAQKVWDALRDAPAGTLVKDNQWVWIKLNDSSPKVTLYAKDDGLPGVFAMVSDIKDVIYYKLTGVIVSDDPSYSSLRKRVHVKDEDLPKGVR